MTGFAARAAFADTLYWVALFATGDPWQTAAIKARKALPADIHLVTTDEVLTEFLTALAGRGGFSRRHAAASVRAILVNENIIVLPQSHQTFLAGLALYEQRSDKGYSLTDCVSMCAMRDLGILEALTNDRHFAQEGFTVLIDR